MRPGERTEVEENRLAVLNLDIRHSEGRVLQEVVWRREREDGPKRAARARCRLNRNRQTVRLAWRDYDVLKDRFYPEDGRHLESIGVRLLGRSVVVPEQKGDLVRASTESGRARNRRSGRVGRRRRQMTQAASVVMTRVTKLCIFCVAISLASTTFGLSSVACVIVPALINGVRSCGIRAVS
jgi:hypothetical protein